MNAEAAPMIHISHIQKHAPGPPRHIAVETPMMFPVPTLEAVDTNMPARRILHFPHQEVPRES